jgi:hypothetical protein
MAVRPILWPLAFVAISVLVLTVLSVPGTGVGEEDEPDEGFPIILPPEGTATPAPTEDPSVPKEEEFPVPPAPPKGTTGLFGRVFDPATGEPIEGAVIEFSPIEVKLLTDRAGYFLLTGIDPSTLPVDAAGIHRLTVDVSAEGYAPHAFVDMDVYPDNIGVLKVPLGDKPGHSDYGRYPTAAAANLSLDNGVAEPQRLLRKRTVSQMDAFTGSAGEAMVSRIPPGSDAVRPGPRPAASCSGYYSNVMPPPTIRVYHNNPETNGDGNIHTVDFKTYSKHVLPREWFATWPMASLQAGAVAVRNFAWHWVNNGPGGYHPVTGECYDVDSTTAFQVWDPNRSDPTTDEAVDSIWNSKLTWSPSGAGVVLPTYYKAGYPSDACGQWYGQPAPGNDMSQNGSKACAENGLQWPRILELYYFTYTPTILDEAPASSAYYQGSDGWRFYVTALGRDRAPYYKYYRFSTGTWSSWTTLGGVCSAGPPAIAYVAGAGALYVLCRGTEGSFWYRAYNGSSWGAWQNLGGDFRSAPGAAGYYQSGQGWHLRVYGVGANSELYGKLYNFATSQWSSWGSQGGACTSTPGVMGRSPDLFILCRATDKAPWYKQWNGSSWSGWSTLGGSIVGGPAITSYYVDGIVGYQYRVYGTGLEGAIWERSYHANSGSWGAWSSLGGVASSSPAAANVVSGPSYLSVFTRGPNQYVGGAWSGGLIWERRWSGSSWGSWTSIGRPP